MSADGSLPMKPDDDVRAANNRLMPIRFGRETGGDLAAAERREWWIGNGLGAYAAGTLALTLTRRYHGLLIAPVDPPLGRALVLAKADAELILGERRIPLFTNRWASGAVAPEGHLAIESFALDGSIPVWRFAIGDCRIEQRIWMEQGAHTTYVAWRLLAAPEGAVPRLAVDILANGRDHHGETWMSGFAPDIAADGERLDMTAAGRFRLRVEAPGGRILSAPEWIENFDLPLERERGLGDRDHHLRIGRAELPLALGEWRGIVASLADGSSPACGEGGERREPQGTAPSTMLRMVPLPHSAGEGLTDAAIEPALARRRAHDQQVVDLAVAANPALAAAPSWVRRLALAADLYVIARPAAGVENGRSVIAGYPWFGDWGRDTMIALPGLTLATGRYADARKILETFARFVDRGMLPNVFPGAGAEPEYNTVDAALWYIEAWRAYVEATGDVAALERAFPILDKIIDWHRRGTRFGIGVDAADGLLRAGEPGVQLTWMDARVGNREVTPRIGKPVEINALWRNALVAMAGFASRLGKQAATYEVAAEQARRGFQRFVRADSEGLFDVIDGPDGDDPTVRPNQILAVSLAASLLDPETRRRVLQVCGRELVTSYGLRSLTPTHPDYRGHYRGGVDERDGSYHQGPVWGWLLGHWALAHYRVHRDAAAAQAWLEPIADHLSDAALGQVSEIFDGDAPHTPRGAPAQAWSVACTLEAWWHIERVKLRNPRDT